MPRRRPSIMIFEIKLRYTSPAVWRLVEIPEKMTLLDLHFVIQKAMGWDDKHLFSFSRVVSGHEIEYYLPETNEPVSQLSENNPADFVLKDVFTKEEDSITYTYDFGDDWVHEIRFRGRKYEDRRLFGYPNCLAGARACPPESCGGIPGYQNLIIAAESGTKRQRDELKKWLGYEFDPDDFSIEDDWVSFPAYVKAMRRKYAQWGFKIN
jgi:hypothetical protein